MQLHAMGGKPPVSSSLREYGPCERIHVCFSSITLFPYVSHWAMSRANAPDEEQFVLRLPTDVADRVRAVLRESPAARPEDSDMQLNFIGAWNPLVYEGSHSWIAHIGAAACIQTSEAMVCNISLEVFFGIIQMYSSQGYSWHCILRIQFTSGKNMATT